MESHDVSNQDFLGENTLYFDSQQKNLKIDNSQGVSTTVVSLHGFLKVS